MEPSDFDTPKPPLTAEFVQAGMALHELFDKGVSREELHRFVEEVFLDNLESAREELEVGE